MSSPPACGEGRPQEVTCRPGPVTAHAPRAVLASPEDEGLAARRWVGELRLGLGVGSVGTLSPATRALADGPAVLTSPAVRLSHHRGAQCGRRRAGRHSSGPQHWGEAPPSCETHTRRLAAAATGTQAAKVLPFQRSARPRAAPPAVRAAFPPLRLPDGIQVAVFSLQKRRAEPWAPDGPRSRAGARWPRGWAGQGAAGGPREAESLTTRGAWRPELLPREAEGTAEGDRSGPAPGDERLRRMRVGTCFCVPSVSLPGQLRVYVNPVVTNGRTPRSREGKRHGMRTGS